MTVFPTEMYKGPHYRVVHGPEEAANLAKQGWAEDKPEDHPYIPITAAQESEELPKKRGRRPASQEENG